MTTALSFEVSPHPRLRICPHRDRPTADPWITDRDGACTECYVDRCDAIDSMRPDQLDWSPAEALVVVA